MANLEQIVSRKAENDTKWKEAQQAERENTTAMQDAGITEITSNPEAYARYLEMQGDNPSYSAGNIALVMFGNPETTTGGNALKFYASVRLDIRKVTGIKDGDQIIGNQVRVKVIKNKVAPPFRKTEFEIMFGEGISKVGEMVDLGVEYGIIQKSGSWYSYNGSKLAQGRDATKTLLKDNPELCEELEMLIKKAIAEHREA